MSERIFWIKYSTDFASGNDVSRETFAGPQHPIEYGGNYFHWIRARIEKGVVTWNLIINPIIKNTRPW
jgi:hypothetical protein